MNIEHAKQVAARLREYHDEHEDVADIISSLCAALEASQEESCMSNDMYNIAVAELEAAQRDAERYRWLRDEAFNSFIVENMTVYPRHGLDQAIDAAIADQGDKK